MGRGRNGSYAEYTCVPSSNVFRLETALPWADLAAIPESYATAWTCLFENLHLAEGQVLLIRGATSALGQAALNIAADAGATVLATTRSAEKSGLLTNLGAHEVWSTTAPYPRWCGNGIRVASTASSISWVTACYAIRCAA